MIFLRLACLIAGLLVLVAPPAVLDVPRSPALLTALLLAASSFFVIGMAGHQIKQSPALGRLCTLMLLAPFLAGAASLWRSSQPLAMWMSGALLCFTMLVSLVLAWLLLRAPSARRVRAREKRLQRPPVLHHL